MLADHVASRAVMSVACIEVPLADASQFGVMSVDANWRIGDFDEKPATAGGFPGHPDRALASMGIYMFDEAFLYEQLTRDAARRRFQPRFRQGHHSLADQIRISRACALLPQQLRHHEQRQAVLA